MVAILDVRSEQFSSFWSTSHPDASYQVSSQLAQGCRRSRLLKQLLTPQDRHWLTTTAHHEHFPYSIFDLITAHTLVSAQSSNFVVFKLQLMYFYLLLFKSIYWWYSFEAIQMSTNNIAFRKKIREKTNKQEAHGPLVTHLSDIATADMQMLCNNFQILSSQLMKRSSFKQFLILKNIWHDSQWSVIIWTNSQSHFNSRINVKFGGNWLSGFWRIMILYM